MTPLFYKTRNLLVWISDGFEDIFDLQMRWVGFIRDNHVWRANDVQWIGPIVDGNIYDRAGHPIAWSNKNVYRQPAPIQPVAPFKPFAPFSPFKPFDPIRPFPPLEPMGGWSSTSFQTAFHESVTVVSDRRALLLNTGFGWGRRVMWMVRSPEGRYASELLTKGIIAIGWADAAGYLAKAKNLSDFYEIIRETEPDSKAQQVINAGRQLYKFFREMKVGDIVVT